MQTKRIFFMAFFLVSISAVAQKSFHNVTVNDNNSPEFSTFQVTVTPNKSVGFSLSIQNPEKKKLQVQIEHKNIGTVVDTIISGENFSQRYNMNEADDGKYVITVSAGKEKISKEIELITVTTRNVVMQ